MLIRVALLGICVVCQSLTDEAYARSASFGIYRSPSHTLVINWSRHGLVAVPNGVAPDIALAGLDYQPANIREWFHDKVCGIGTPDWQFVVPIDGQREVRRGDYTFVIDRNVVTAYRDSMERALVYSFNQRVGIGEFVVYSPRGTSYGERFRLTSGAGILQQCLFRHRVGHGGTNR